MKNIEDKIQKMLDFLCENGRSGYKKPYKQFNQTTYVVTDHLFCNLKELHNKEYDCCELYINFQSKSAKYYTWDEPHHNGDHYNCHEDEFDFSSIMNEESFNKLYTESFEAMKIKVREDDIVARTKNAMNSLLK